ncbi:MAG: hypothetical protein JNM34_07660 [Chthonomonadaceae bacterium]|nr:hypothetical protein [Chthonomonadaceae bacterium]
MDNQSESTPLTAHGVPVWGGISVAAVVGLVAAAVLANRRPASGRKFLDVDDLVSAADKIADTLESALIRDHSRAS